MVLVLNLFLLYIAMVTCLLHSLPPIAPLPHRPLSPQATSLTRMIKNEDVLDEKKQQRALLFSKTAVLVAVSSFMDAMMNILWYEKEIIHPPTRTRTPLPPTFTTAAAAATPVKREKQENKNAFADEASVAVATPPAALQEAPRWSLTHVYARDMRVNHSELRMLAAEYNMMHDSKITRPLRNRHFLKQRQDDFVWGRKSLLRITTTL